MAGGWWGAPYWGKGVGVDMASACCYVLSCPVCCLAVRAEDKEEMCVRVCWEATPHVGRVDVVFAACCPACPDPCVVLQYGLKKKEVHVEEEPDPMSEGRVGRKKKTPAELAAENNPDSDDDEFASKFSSLCCCMNFV